MSQTSPSIDTSHQQTAESGQQIGSEKHRTLRIWPAFILVAAILFAKSIIGLLEEPSIAVITSVVMGPALAAVLIFFWWGTFSRACWQEKLAGIIAIIAVGFATTMLMDKSMLGLPLITSVVPIGLAAFATALIIGSRMMPVQRTTLAIVALLIGFGYWTLVRSDGMWGDFQSSRSWRWQPTAEDLFLENVASRTSVPTDASELPPLATPAWPGFRGPDRNATVRGVKILTDWKTHPPKELWRTSVGPGWSSFAVAGRRVFTMEQRGENEVVVCFDGDNGHELWIHQYPSRFWEAMGGAGPRSTPTIADGNLFTLGADGILSRLDPLTGESIWQRDLKNDADRKPPTWGFSASPLVVGDVVIVHAGGKDNKGMFAYSVESGEPIWSAPSGDHSYSSPQLLTIDDQEYVVMVSNAGLSLYDPTDGRVASRHEWKSMGYRTLQPLLIDDTNILIGSGMGEGARRIEFSGSGDTLAAKEVWTSVEMESDFNDFVAHKGNLFGFDRTIFACVDLRTGERLWKKGRYGNGQVLLLPDAGQLLVSSEKGEVILLNANADELDELARVKIFDGKTWNHPVLVGNRLYLRNAEEAACFEMPVANGDSQSPATVE